METSFFLTPDFKERAVDLAYRDASGTLHPWDNQIEIIEQDPSKGMLKINFLSYSGLSWGGRRSDLYLCQFTFSSEAQGYTPL